MVLTFPAPVAQVADRLRIESIVWREFRLQDFGPLGGGEVLTADLAPMLWEAQISTMQMYHADAEAVAARIRALDGGQRALYLYDSRKKYPAADPTGTILGASTVLIDSINVNRRYVALEALPAGYVITAGDKFHVDYSSGRRALIEFSEDGVADGSGVTPELEVRPVLRSGIAAGATAVLAKPAMKAKIVPDTLTSESSGRHTRLSFTARQTLEASS